MPVSVCAVIVVSGMENAVIFLFLVGTYIGLGLAEEVIFFQRRRDEARLAADGTGAQVLASTSAHDEERDDEEVLRELGAFDTDDNDSAGTGDDAAAKLAPHTNAPKGA